MTGARETIARLRVASQDDVGMIEHIVEAAYSPYVPRMGRLPGPMLDDYAALVAAGCVEVIGRCGAVEGILVLIPKSDHLLLDNVAVLPEAQGFGLGSQMLKAAERAARAMRYRTIRLYTHETMTENLERYAGLGYHETHRKMENGLKRVYLAKDLE